MSLQVSLPDHVFIINKISLFTSNLRREKQNEPQMPAIVYFFIYLFFVVFCYFGIPLQKQLVQTLTVILKQITRITNRVQPDYVRNGAFEKKNDRKEDRCPHKLIWLAHWCVFLSLRGVWLRILLTFFLDRGNHVLVYGPDKAHFLSSSLLAQPLPQDGQYGATLTYLSCTYSKEQSFFRS